MPRAIRNLGADVELLEIACNRGVTDLRRSFIDALAVIPVPVCSAPMQAARLLPGLLTALLASAAACGGSNQPANDQTTVTIEKPSGSATPPPASTQAPGNGK